jgi:hypothetical protein
MISLTELSMNPIGNDAARDAVRRAQGAAGARTIEAGARGNGGERDNGEHSDSDERADRRAGEARQAAHAPRAADGGRVQQAGHADHGAGLQRALEQQLAAMRFTTDAPHSRGAALEALAARGLDRLPLPGRGRTVERWSALAAVAACDLSLVKLYEGHTDALAILAELRAFELAAPGQRWGVFAAEPPNRKVTAVPDRNDARENVPDSRRDDARDHARDGAYEGARGDAATNDPDGPSHARSHAGIRAGRDTSLRLEGVKPWCSGAALLTHALVTAWRYGEPVLAAVELAQPSVHVSDGGWNAIGMAATGTSEVCFDGALAVQIGAAGAYLARPGFWHGGAGIAACWYGCAVELAAALRAQVVRREEPHACAHLGAADAQLAAAGALLRETAAWIDRAPRADAMRRAMRVRLAVEEAASAVLAHVTRALGAGPLCTDLRFARAAADLPVFLRQSHAERDAAALGEALRNPPDPLACEPDPQWRLACL